MGPRRTRWYPVPSSSHGSAAFLWVETTSSQARPRLSLCSWTFLSALASRCVGLGDCSAQEAGAWTPEGWACVLRGLQLPQVPLSPQTMSIVSYNHLGNNDGQNLSAPPQFRSKEVSKSSVVDDMVHSNPVLYSPGERPDHCVRGAREWGQGPGRGRAQPRAGTRVTSCRPPGGHQIRAIRGRQQACPG